MKMHVQNPARRAVAMLLVWQMVFSISLPAYAQLRPEQVRSDPNLLRPRSFRGYEAPSNLPQDPSQMTRPNENVFLNRSSQMSEGALASVTYQVHIVGEVENPGTFPLAASHRLQDAIQLSGGVKPNGSLRHIQVRDEDGSVRVYDLLRFQLYGDLQQNPFLQDNDVVQVPLRKQVVQVVGAVRRPQTYELRAERTVADLVKLAGGMTVGVERAAPIRVIRYENSEKRVLEVTQNARSMHSQRVYGGDVLYVPNTLSAGHEFDYNLSSIPGDEAFYPSYEDRVFILGGLNVPGPYGFNPQYTLRHYLSLAGGTTSLAKTNHIKLVRANGHEVRLRNADVSTRINPGDTIYVPERNIRPETWISIVLGIAGFALSVTTTAVALSR